MVVMIARIAGTYHGSVCHSQPSATAGVVGHRNDGGCGDRDNFDVANSLPDKLECEARHTILALYRCVPAMQAHDRLYNRQTQAGAL